MQRGVMQQANERPCVLVFAGHDPSGGAGIQADIEAIAAQGAHALPIITALTVQDNNRVYAIEAVSCDMIKRQAQTLLAQIPIAAIKIGILGSAENAFAIAQMIMQIRQLHPHLPVILDPVLASGHGDSLSVEDAVAILEPLYALSTVITPNLPELARLCPLQQSVTTRAAHLLHLGCAGVLVKGGHSSEVDVCNQWFIESEYFAWHWPRLHGEFHGSGCTLASALAAQLALGVSMQAALDAAQQYTHHALQHAYAIASGQTIPLR